MDFKYCYSCHSKNVIGRETCFFCGEADFTNSSADLGDIGSTRLVKSLPTKVQIDAPISIENFETDSTPMKTVNTQAQAKRPFYKKKKFISLFLVVLLLLIWGYRDLPKSQAESREAETAIGAYQQITSKCLDVSKENSVVDFGDARSSERLKAINSFFVPLVQATCITNQGNFYVNEFKGINLSKLNNPQFSTKEYSLLQGILYDLDFGFSQFTKFGTICADGSLSGSVGRGTCSWHGGYAHPRGTKLTYDSLPALTNPKNAERPNSYGLGNLIAEPQALEKSTTANADSTCVKSENEIIDCFPKLLWNRSVCSEASSANLEVFIEKWYFPVSSITGEKSDRCNSQYPYLINISGSALVNYSMRLVFQSVDTHKVANSYFSIEQE